jgi:hypothetical protein
VVGHDRMPQRDPSRGGDQCRGRTVHFNLSDANRGPAELCEAAGQGG